MSFLVGSLAGAVATGGVYYGFSNLMQTRHVLVTFCTFQQLTLAPTPARFPDRTAQHRSDLRHLSDRLGDASAKTPGPLPASKRIVERPFVKMLQARWNEDVASVYSAVGRWEQHASDWAKKVLYGEA